MSAQQRNLQRKLFLRMVHELLSEKFIKSVAIGQGWVEEVLQKKTTATKTAVTAAAGVALSVVLPGLGGMIAGAASAGAEWEYRRHQAKLNRKHALGITSLKQLAMVSDYIEQALLYRYQDFVSQQNLLLSYDAMKTFVDCLLKRMFLYVEELDTPEEIRALLGKGLVNLNTHKKVTQAAVPDAKFTEPVAEQIAENLVAGTSLVNVGLLERFSSSTNALVSCLTMDGGTRDLRVSDICHSPTVALTEEAEKTGILEYEGRYASDADWGTGSCGVVCIGRKEATLRGLDAAILWEDSSLPVPKPRSDIAALRAKVKELEQQLAAQSQTSKADAKSDAVEAKAISTQPKATTPTPPKLLSQLSAGNPQLFRPVSPTMPPASSQNVGEVGSSIPSAGSALKMSIAGDPKQQTAELTQPLASPPLVVVKSPV